MPIRPGIGGGVEERLRRLELVTTFSEKILAFPVIEDTTFDTSGVLLGFAMDRGTFRPLLQDERWFVYAAGWVNPVDANIASLSLTYQKDDQSFVTLGTITRTGGGWVKFAMGPYDVFKTAGVPAGETIPVIRFKAIKDAGASGTTSSVTIYLRLLPRVF